MDVVENMVDGDTIFDQVDPENRDIFREIFLNEDSEEEFLGFDPKDLENDEGTMPFVDTWVRGNLDVNCPESRGEKKIIMLTWGRTVKCWIFLGYSSRMNLLMMSLSGTKYAADFSIPPQGRNLKPHSRFHKWVTN